MLWLGHDGKVGRTPLAYNGVGHLGAAPEVEVHVLPRERQRGLGPEVGGRLAGGTPYNVKRLALVQGDCIGEERAGVVGLRHVRGEIVELLGLRVAGGGLEHEEA